MILKICTFVASFIAMVLIAASYFFSKKERYLFFQGLGILFLSLSYLFDGAYFAMVGLAIALLRTAVCFWFEKRDRFAPVWFVVLVCALTFAAYFIVDFAVLKTAKPLDILCLCSLVGYTLVFRIRNVRVVRYAAILPITLSLLYNILSKAALFAVLAYAFELGASIVSIVKYRKRRIHL